MIIEHTRIENGVQVPCDGKFVSIGTMVAPNRYICTRCRTVKVLNDRDEIVEDVWDRARTLQDPTPKVGILRRLLRWLW